jgi:hypothetical protein
MPDPSTVRRWKAGKSGIKGMDMSRVASLIGQFAGRPVAGSFGVRLEFSQKPGDDRPDIVLGLKLEAGPLGRTGAAGGRSAGGFDHV